MAATQTQGETFRLIRAVPEPLALYIRSRREDKAPLSELMAAGTTNMSGVVFEPTRVRQDKELRESVSAKHLDTVLDPKTQQLATPSGYTPSLGKLPWGGGNVHVLEDFLGQNCKRRTSALSEFAIAHDFSAVLAPTHLIRNSSDPWLAIDADATRRLRDDLDRKGASNTAIFYNLALPYAMFRDADERDALIRTLEELPVEQIWLKVDGLGSSATPAALANYIAACGDFNELKRPLLADHFGGMPGLALLALGEVAGICHGVTLAEQFSSSAWLKKREGDLYSLRTRVYLPKVDLHLDMRQAKSVTERNAKVRALFGCHDRQCCDRGLMDMFERPGKHFLFQRMKQIGLLGRIPASMRGREFVDGELRRVTEDLIKASNLDVGDDTLKKRIAAQRKRIDGLRVMLSKRLSQEATTRATRSVVTRRAREAGYAK